MYQKYIKRFLDFIIALIALPFVLLIILIVSPFILFDDGFPIFYNANRIGQYGKLFKMYKFRSMKKNAPDIRLVDGSTYNGEDDPRVTKIGKILRKTSIDEIPQLLNMLKGDMSLIGPRPDPPDWLEKYPEDVKIFLNVKPGITGYNQAYYRNSADGGDMSLIGPRPDPPDWLEKYPEDVKIFLNVKPGITGYNQAYYRNSADGEEKMKNDAYYAIHCSFVIDVKIFFKTIMTVLGNKNTYKDSEKESNKLDEIAKKEVENLKRK